MAAIEPTSKAIPEHVPKELIRPIGLTEGPEFLMPSIGPHFLMSLVL